MVSLYAHIYNVNIVVYKIVFVYKYCTGEKKKTI